MRLPWLPAIFFYWLLCVLLFIFLRRRVSLPLAAVGMLIPVTVPPVLFFAIQARPYGMMLGFSMAAVLCWDLTNTPACRRWAIPGLALSLAGAIASHYFTESSLPNAT